LLQGCSAIKIAYNNAPDLLYWWLDGYLDFNEAQTPKVREDIARLHQWHRTNELPRYADLVQRLEKMLPEPWTPDAVCAVIAEMEGRFSALTAQAEPAVVSLAMTITPEQLQHMERKYGKTDAEYRNDWLKLTPGEQKAKRFDATLERVEMIYGSLDSAQKAVIRRELDQSSFDAQLIYNERQRRQQDAVQTLRKVTTEKMSYDDARAAMRGYLQRSMRSPDPVYRQYAERLRSESCKRVAAAHDSTTPAQRDIAVRRLQSYARNFLELSSQK
jgi:hypothetical protein